MDFRRGRFLSITESFDGTSWSEVADLSTARREAGSTVGSAATSSLAAYFGGKAPSASNATEEWNVTHALKKVTIS